MRAALVACPSCACHMERSEKVCPHCGEVVSHGPTGQVSLTKSAVALGLAVSVAGTGLLSCDSETSSDYGAGGSIGEGGGPTSSSSKSGSTSSGSSASTTSTTSSSSSGGSTSSSSSGGG